MRKIFEDIFIKHLPTIDLHGYDRDTAKIAVEDFIYEQYLLNNPKVVIVHGVGTGILKQTVHQALQHHKLIISYQLHNFNIGCTIATLKTKKDE